MNLKFSGVGRLKILWVYTDVTVQPFYLPFFCLSIPSMFQHDRREEGHMQLFLFDIYIYIDWYESDLEESDPHHA